MGTAFGDQATYTCNDGLVAVSGDTTRTCEANGQWSGSEPMCGKQLQSIFISQHNTTKLIYRTPRMYRVKSTHLLVVCYKHSAVATPLL